MKVSKKILRICFIAVFLVSICGFNSYNADAAVTGQAIVDYAETFIGTPYVPGGTTPNGFDCSGFVQYVYSHFGISLPRTSQQQSECGSTVSLSNLQPGDLVFFEPDSNGLPNHVGIYIGNGEFIESPHTGASVRINYLSSDPCYEASRISGVMNVTIPQFALNITPNSVPLLKDYMVTQSKFYLCSAPDSSASTNDYLTYGAKVNVYAQSNGWYLVNNTNPQWIPAGYVMPTNQLNPVATGFVTASTGACLENPSLGERDTGDLPYGSPVTIYEGYDHFYLVNDSASLQWMDLNIVKITSMPNIPTANSSTQPITTYYAPAGTKCYQFPIQNINNINGTIDTGKTVNVYATYGNWYLVNNGTPQWIEHN